MATQYWCCDYGCGFQDESLSSVERHEMECDLNPENSSESEPEEIISVDNNEKLPMCNSNYFH
jgi:hypothetical protein